MYEENPKIKMLQLGHYLRSLMDDSQLSFAAYKALRIAQQIYLGMITGIHANIKDIMPDITKFVHCCIYDASAEANWHISLFNHKLKKKVNLIF